jgi:hypothetical protein
MDLVLKALVIVTQLVVAGFVVWGGWLCFREWLRGDRASEAPAAPPAAAVRETPESFERVASLVLLALLCTTLAGLG